MLDLKLISGEMFVKSTHMDLQFIPILQLKPDLIMGLLEDSNWVVEGKNNTYILTTPQSFWRVVVLLERPLNEVREDINRFAKSMNLDIDVSSVFPFIEIVRAGFEFGTTYWAEMAFCWYDELPIKEKIKLKDSLKQIKNEKWASQKLRHKAMKEMKRNVG